MVKGHIWGGVGLVMSYCLYKRNKKQFPFPRKGGLEGLGDGGGERFVGL